MTEPAPALPPIQKIVKAARLTKRLKSHGIFRLPCASVKDASNEIAKEILEKNPRN